MANVKFVLNREGVRELMRSSEMLGVCWDYAEKAMGSLGAGYEVSPHTGKNRVNVQVSAETYAARRDNLENNSILKALRG